MLNQYEELAVLDQGDDGAIVSIRGQGGPSVLLGPGYLHHLDRVLAMAIGEVEIHRPAQGVRLLCAEVQTLLATYEEIQNKFYGQGAPKAARSLAEVLQELAELRREIEDLRR